MPGSGHPRSPAVPRGALVRLIDDLGEIRTEFVRFQYNPATLRRSFEPWNPFATDPQDQAARTPLVQPFQPQESFSFELEFDATDAMAAGDASAATTGVTAHIAALRQLIEPLEQTTSGLIGAPAAPSGGAGRRAERAQVPVTLLVLGKGTVLPVRITELAIEVLEFLPTLYPLMAKATLSLQVLTPDVFKCRGTATTDIAIAAYEFTRLQDDELAQAATADGGDGELAMLPI